MRGLATNFGTEITSQTPEAWATEASLDWKVDEHEVVIDGKVLEGNKALVNSSSGTVLNIVSDKYKVVQPLDMLNTFHLATEKTGFKMNRMGCYGDGKVIWGRADMDASFAVNNNDELNYYMYFVTSTDGSAATHSFISTMRAVCMNALNIASQDANIYMNVRHSKEYHVDEFGMRLNHLENATDEFEANIKTLAQSTFDGVSEFRSIYTDLFGEKPSEAGRSQTMYSNKFDTAWNDVYTNPGVEFTNTFSLWNLLNAFTYNIDHRNAARSDENAHRHTIMRGGAKEKLRIMDNLLARADAKEEVMA